MSKQDAGKLQTDDFIMALAVMKQHQIRRLIVCDEARHVVGVITRSDLVRIFFDHFKSASEGYLVDPADWSEEFVRRQAAHEGLQLKGEHWEIIRFQRHWYETHGQQASVRDMIKHFRELWGEDKGSNQYLHQLFPRGGPQKQGNRLAGLLRTKGEH